MQMGECEGEEEDEATEWQRWERGVQWRSYKETVPTFRIQGFLGNCTTICAFQNSLKRYGGPLSGLPCNYSPYRPFFDATWNCTPNIHRLLRNTIKAQ